MKKVLLSCSLFFLTACTTLPEGVGRVEYLFGGVTAEREAELVCLRWEKYYPSCGVAKLEVISNEVANSPGQCTGHTYRANELAREWGYEDRGFVFIPATKLRSGHVAATVTVKGEIYVIDNGAFRAGVSTLKEYTESVEGKFQVAIHKTEPFEGDTATAYGYLGAPAICSSESCISAKVATK